MAPVAPLRAYWRFVLVLRQFLPLVVGYARDRHRFVVVGPGRRVTPEMRRRRAERLLESLLTLGPTFVKLGQLLSTRPDVLPPEYVAVMAQLQDEVPPAPWEAARDVVEAELGPLEARFESFDPDAISGASLGQVYRATVDGQPVAVKVRRPGVERLVEADLSVIRWLLPIVIRFVGRSRAFSLENLADEFAKTIREEMDYLREARMLREIRANFEADDSVRMPRLIASHSAERVMTMEYVPGVKITDTAGLDAAGHDRGRLAETLTRAYFKMIIVDGVFHADPHPGNLAVQPDGTIVFYDFGMAGHVDPAVQARIVEFYVAVANQDIDGILDALIAMGTLSPAADRETMGRVMELAIEDARGRRVEHYRVQRIIQQVEDTIYEFPFRLPRNLALIMRVATVVEGVCVTLDEDFDFVAVATAFLTEHGYREEAIERVIEALRGDVREAARSSIRVPPKLEDALDRIERGTVRVQAELRDPHDVLDLLAKRIVLGLAFAAALVSTVAAVSAAPVAAVGLGLLTAVLGIALVRSFREPRRLRPTPQFTRQAMRAQRGGRPDEDDEP